ncbi:hypothetical protein Bca52824_026076 [Brassica carinata]|uniref:Cytochrome P450 n=1 Tax=Brassica carinata TaxID=52824 RepID=A0A8X7SHC6_BRACI|nr:hypothetical protein Bca52824_026076 [Brassica carinata]
MDVDFQNSFLFILLCLLSLLCYSLYIRKPQRLDLPPSPPSLPIIGHFHLILSLLIHKSFQKLSSKHGPLLYLRIFNVPIVLVSSSSVASEIFKTHDLNVSFRGLPPLDESLLFGSSTFLMAPQGDYLKFMKKLLVTNLLGSQALERSRCIRADELELFYANLLGKAMNKEVVDIGKEAMSLSNSIIFKMLMGRSFCYGEAERARGLVIESFALFKKIALATLLHKPLKKFGISLFKKDIMSVSDRFDELLERVLVKHEEEKRSEHQSADMMDVLLEAFRDQNAESKITRNHIKTFFIELFIAGTDSMGQSTQWAMAELMNSPNILERLRKEIESVVGKTSLIQETDLPNLPYLQAVVKEVLRLHPPAPLFARTSREECRIRGFYIPENTTLLVNVYAVMRDPNSWEDPNEFKPERFLASLGTGEEDERREQAHKYIPFGSGRRGCPGANLTYIFVGTAVGMMVQCFDWKIEGGQVKLEEAAGELNLTMAHPLRCTPVARAINPFGFQITCR